MSTNTAKLILKRAGLLCFDIRELSSLLADRYNPLPNQVREAILTLRHPQEPIAWKP